MLPFCLNIPCSVLARSCMPDSSRGPTFNRAHGIPVRCFFRHTLHFGAVISANVVCSNDLLTQTMQSAKLRYHCPTSGKCLLLPTTALHNTPSTTRRVEMQPVAGSILGRPAKIGFCPFFACIKTGPSCRNALCGDCVHHFQSRATSSFPHCGHDFESQFLECSRALSCAGMLWETMCVLCYHCLFTVLRVSKLQSASVLFWVGISKFFAS